MATTSDTDEGGPRVFSVGGRGNDERIFRSAVRHSKCVRILRIAIPIGVIGAVATVVLVGTLMKPLRALAKLPVDLGQLVVSGTKVTMKQPRIAGFTRDQRQYELMAESAAQDLTRPDEVELQSIRAMTEMKDKTIFEATARRGTYHTKTELLVLKQNIWIVSSSGYKARLSEAVLDIRGGKITSDKPVEVTTHAWTIKANRMELADSGDLIRFEQDVSVTLVPQPEMIQAVQAQAGRP